MTPRTQLGDHDQIFLLDVAQIFQKELIALLAASAINLMKVSSWFPRPFVETLGRCWTMDPVAFQVAILRVSLSSLCSCLSSAEPCHAVSFAGLTYLALFICAKFAITIPSLNYQTFTSG